VQETKKASVAQVGDTPWNMMKYSKKVLGLMG